MTLEQYPRWWAMLCARFGQHPGDPDAFCTTSPALLRQLVAEAKAEYGEDPITVEVEDLGF